MHNILCVVEMFLPYPLCRERFTSHSRVFHSQNYFWGPKWQFRVIILRTFSTLSESPENQGIVNNLPIYSLTGPQNAQNTRLVHKKQGLAGQYVF